ncbi:MAG TPA: amino acid ABC transporter permease [Alphaproteobacteria bacterium]|nr:amino acid ABC transporter permease [Alphaproteobacteria bacterium]
MTADGLTAKPASAVWYRDPRIRSIFFQVAALAAVIWVGWYLADNTVKNMERQNIAAGFGFLETTAGFGIIQKLIPYSETSSYGVALIVSLLNTILIAFVGILLATVLGFTIGVARLSSNWLVRKIATIYIETFRNIPLLLQIFFWYHAVLKPLPGPRESLTIFDSFVLNNRGFYVPSLKSGWASLSIVLVFIAGIIVTKFIGRWAKARQEKTGEQFPMFAVGLALIVGAPALLWLILSFSIGYEVPKLTGFNYEGGVNIIPEFVAMLIALAVYTASFIAEIVRAGIQSVSHGQTEAARALGLRPRPTLNQVIIPQAMRVIIPPLTSQYLNLTKNSSLATAIAYPDLTSVFAGTVLNQTGQAVEIIAITMAIYLTISLLTSGYMNWYNARKALVER